jgi:heme exporter protein D
VDGLISFLSMGGYAAFIWPAYGISALVLAALLIDSRRRLAARQAELAALGAAGGTEPGTETGR